MQIRIYSSYIEGNSITEASKEIFWNEKTKSKGVNWNKCFARIGS